MNLNRKLVITAVTAAFSASLLTVASLNFDWSNAKSRWTAVWGDTLPFHSGPSRGGTTPTSLSLEDGGDKYIVTLRLPSAARDSVKVKLSGGVLDISAPGAAGTFHQQLALTDVDPGATPAVERGSDPERLTVTVPKTGSGAGLAGANSPWSLKDPDDLFSRMWREMSDFSAMPGFPGGNIWNRNPYWDDSAKSSFEIHERDGTYVAELRLPGCAMKNVKANVDGRVLTVEAESRTEEDGGRTTSVVRHSRTLTLPGPVDVSGMKVEPEGDRLRVILPKAPS